MSFVPNVTDSMTLCSSLHKKYLDERKRQDERDEFDDETDLVPVKQQSLLSELDRLKERERKLSHSLINSEQVWRQ